MSAIEVIFAAVTVGFVGVILYMLRSAYKGPGPNTSEASTDHPYQDDTPLAALESYVRERIESIEKPALILALKTRLEMEESTTDSERRLLFFEIISDLDRLQPEPLPSTLRQSLNNPLALTTATNRDGAAMRIAVARMRSRLVTMIGSEQAAPFLEGFPPADNEDPAPWTRALQDGSTAKGLDGLLEYCTKELGHVEANQLLEGAARKVGQIFPLSCLKTFLAAFPSGLLSAEKASASARDRIWDDFLAARQDLDMARVRLAEAEMNKWASVGRLAAGMAHEINNPLVYITGNLALIKDELLEEQNPPDERPEQMDMLTDVMEGLDRIQSIVRDLQVFSRTRRGQRRPVDLEKALQSTIKIVGAQIGRGLEFRKEFDGVPKVYADEGKIGQILLNLLVNASHASVDATRDAVTVRSTLAGDTVIIDIEDQGGGVPNELQDQIFEPFFTTKEVDQGTGLGLAISREIAEQHGGSLILDPCYHDGARFRLTLPIGTAEPSAPTRMPTSQPARALHILFVDDDEAIRTLATRILARSHTLELAQDGEEAQNFLRKDQSFDVIVLDLQLPKLDGSELFAWLEREFPELASRVLIMSGGATTAHAADFLADHTKQTLRKPASPEQLRQAILRIANQSAKA